MGVQELVVGMAHRGRLKRFANIFNKTYKTFLVNLKEKEYEDNLFVTVM